MSEKKLSYLTVELDMRKSNANLVSGRNLHSSSGHRASLVSRKDWADLKNFLPYIEVGSQGIC